MRYLPDIIVICILTAMIISYGFIVTNQVQKEMASCQDFARYLSYGERYQLYDAVSNKTIAQKTVLNGLYQPSNDIYCIWSQHPNISQNLETNCHEYCHYLIDEGTCYETRNGSSNNVTCKEHFCED